MPTQPLHRPLWPAPDARAVDILDQTALPHAKRILRLATLEDAAHAIRSMQVRGAPLIGVTAAYGIAFALAARPDDAILSEEEKDNIARSGVSRAWIVDPLDGTREYSEGRSDWAVHIALAVDGVPTVGAVALPGLGLTLTSGSPKPLAPANVPLRMLVSRTRPAAEAVYVAEKMGAELLAMGSAGAKAMAVVPCPLGETAGRVNVFMVFSCCPVGSTRAICRSGGGLSPSIVGAKGIRRRADQPASRS